MVLEAPGGPLLARRVKRPAIIDGQVLLRVEACGVCRTDLHLLDGELPDIPYPMIPGHQIVGQVVASKAAGIEVDQRVGVPWLGWTCGECRFCRNDEENLCDSARFTGYHLDGGFAEYVAADARYCFPLPPEEPAEQVAPLLCAGLIGYRSLRLCGDNVERLGIFGFGAAGHLVAGVAHHLGIKVYAFTRPGDGEAQHFARGLGCVWAGSSEQRPEEHLDAAIIFAPVGELVPAGLRVVRKGGRVVCGGIHMSEIPAFAYSLLWGERQLCSVANLTRQDGLEFLALAKEAELAPEVVSYPLAESNQALDDLRNGRFTGAAVVVP
jgi:propanol-preferring alcohol dehydrogenase